MSHPISRRKVLQGLGGMALSLPILPSLLSRAEAQALGKPPLRFIAIQSRDGTFESEFWPRNNPTQLLAPGVYGQKLTDISGPISNVISTSFDGVRHKLAVIRGLDYLHFAFHRSAAPFSASETPSGSSESAPPTTGSSIDCIIENSRGLYTTPTRFSALRIADYRKHSFWRPEGGRAADVRTMATMNGSKNVFNYLFNGIASGSPTATTNERLILDQVGEQFKAFMKQRGLSSEDKRRVEATAELVNDIQRRTSMVAGVCSAPALRFNDANNLSRYDDYTDSIVAAFSCDLTRVATMFLGHHQDVGGGSDVHHANSHESSTSEAALLNCRTWDGWMAKRVGNLMRKLDSIIESDGSTLLDNTVIIWANEDGVGNQHGSESIPVIIGGGARGALQMGYYLDYRARPLKPGMNIGVPYPQMLVAAMKAMGVQSDEYMKQGDDNGFGMYAYHFARRQPDVENRRSQPLPFFYKGA